MDSKKELKEVVGYMKAHWPSRVKAEWQVGLEQYPGIVKQAMTEMAAGTTRGKRLIRIAGLSGSGKTTQILPAVEAYNAKNQVCPVLVAAREFVKYHPFVEEIREFYGEENLRKMTDEFSTIMMFMVLDGLTREGYDIVLDVTLLDPTVERILVKMLTRGSYAAMLLMIATSPAVTEKFLEGRMWRHTRETELEFIRATVEALRFYAAEQSAMRVIIWSVYDRLPVYDGAASGCVEVFQKYSEREELPAKDDDERRAAKIKYMEEL